MAAEAEGAVDDGLAGAGLDGGEHVVKEDGNVGGGFHGGMVAATHGSGRAVVVLPDPVGRTDVPQNAVDPVPNN